MPTVFPAPGNDPAAWAAINTIRVLAMDAVEKARSGHPGTPMALAPVGYVLWTRHLRHAPTRPDWPDRDRFVLSCGHASMLLYSLLHLTGYDLPLEEIVNFRQWGSETPGHPERGHTAGVETTTGPLGQGIGNAVGMAMAERYLASRFNRPGKELVDHRVWALVSDGDLMEGVASEAASLAGHLRLGKLNLIYDDNKITIDGTTALSFSEDVGRRFEAYGWHVEAVDDGNDLDAIDRALTRARTETSRPSLVILRTVIGDPAPTKRNTPEAHGAPLGKDEIARTKALLNWPSDPFHVPVEVKAHLGQCVDRGRDLLASWDATRADLELGDPDFTAEFTHWLNDTIEIDWDQVLPVFKPSESLATRQASATVLNAIAAAYPSLLGGSADLAGSTGVGLKGATTFSATEAGRSVAWGIREHAMGAAMNGMAAHGGVRPFGSTFLVFADYMKPSIRLAALMHLPVIYVFTHDSIGVGEDGPTHQPIEHLAMLRGIPNLAVIRPGSPAETAQAWRAAIERRDGPTALILTRQTLPRRSRDPLGDRGAPRRLPRFRPANSAGGDHHGHRVRAFVGHRRRPTAQRGGDPDPSRVAQFMGALPSPAPGLSGDCPAQRDSGPGLGGSGHDFRLGSVGYRSRRVDWHRSLWRLGPRRSALRGVRDHHRSCDRSGPARPSTEQLR